VDKSASVVFQTVWRREISRNISPLKTPSGRNSNANLGLLAASLVRFPEEEFARSAVEKALVKLPASGSAFGDFCCASAISRQFSVSERKG